MFKTAIVVGSLRKASTNRKLARAIARLGQGRFTAEFAEIGDLPLFNEDLEASVPASVTRLKQQIEGADAVLFVTPEYNRATPGVLKNAIDWASRPYGKSAFKGKPAAVIGTSPGSIGTAVAQHNLRGTLAYLDMVIMSQPEAYIQFTDGLIDDDGKISKPETEKFLQGFADSFAAWSERHIGSFRAAA